MALCWQPLLRGVSCSLAEDDGRTQTLNVGREHTGLFVRFKYEIGISCKQCDWHFHL